MSPAPDTGRTAEENEFRTGIIEALNAAFRGFSFPGGRWSTGYGAEMAADALLSGPLAPILQEAATARKERDEAREIAGLEWRVPDVDAWGCVAEQKGFPQFRERFNRLIRRAILAEDKLVTAEQEAATLRARLQEAEKALRPFSAAVFNDNGDVTISTGHLMTRDWLAAKRARAALAAKAAPLPETRSENTGGRDP